MNCTLRFVNGLIHGPGTDDIAPFSFNGNYTESLNVEITKSYYSHQVIYVGCADENGIWGKWRLYDCLTGGFHIWPVKENHESLKREEEKKLVKSSSFTNPQIKELVTIR